MLFKNKNRNYQKKGQVVLELALVMSAFFLLVAGMFRVIYWFNDDMVRRQMRYDKTRLVAGKFGGEDSEGPMVSYYRWPDENGDPDGDLVQPQELGLDHKWMYKGEFPEKRDYEE